ncbi:MAG: [FeFe] hydrogenase H-cluster radical SAM maturase HydG [Treponema sp. CETP13]|nr:MAG: [FeFe] hydrogenase H-cluster radical SAM maturase HydG [Treponema sp. CETP13]
MTDTQKIKDWKNHLVKQDEIDRYLVNGKDFIDDDAIEAEIAANKVTTEEELHAILDKAKDINLMPSKDVAKLVNITDPKMRNEIYEAACQIKKQVYDNRLVTFAPLYCGSKCVNRCKYCGFRTDNDEVERRVLTMDEIKAEAKVLAGKIGHKRLVMVYGEHPETDAQYIADSMRAVYSVKVPTKNGFGQIRRVNINAAPLPIDDLKILKEAGIGTFQVFQETYHKKTYKEVHPAGTLKGNYAWRLYALHRSMDAGIDDVAVGALFGLYDWKFEVMGLVAHAADLEKRYGIGPHSVSVPRLEPAEGTDFSWVKHWVSDEDFKHLVAVLRVAIPYAGLIVTNREKPEMLDSIIDMITQRDADSRLGIGAYADAFPENTITSDGHQESQRQQFVLGDMRSLDTVVQESIKRGHIVSFCTAGYRCGRTGTKIMSLLKAGKEGHFCKMNAILTLQEYLDDFASPETQKMGNALISKELGEIKNRTLDFSQAQLVELKKARKRIQNGERDIYF